MELQKFLESRTFPGKLIFAKVWGSRSHNTSKPDSDWDFSGVYLAPTKSILGMGQPPESVQKDGQEKPDYAFHEAGKFCKLLLVGNPGILEMLYTEKMCVETPEWLSLKRHRRKFLSKSAVGQYIGYAEGQLKRLRSRGGKGGLHTSGGGYTEKFAYHLTRLLIDVERIASGIEPVVWKDGQERDYLMRIRNGEVPQDEVEREARERVERVREVESRDDYPLPEAGDRDLLENWLVELRLTNLSLTPSQTPRLGLG